MRLAIVNRHRHVVGGVEAYLRSLAPMLRSHGHALGLWHEYLGPTDRPAIEGDASEWWCCASMGARGALDALARWKPDVVFVHGLSDPTLEAEIVTHAPGVFFAHDYHGTCISGTKCHAAPAPVPCARRFGPACLLHYYPRRCGGLSPVRMMVEYRRQARRLSVLARYRRILTFSEHMRAEYLKHGFGANLVARMPLFLPRDPGEPSTAVEPTPADGARSARGAAAPIDLAFVGRLERVKGCRMLIDALPLVRSALGRPVTLRVAGDGGERAACAEAAVALRHRDPDVVVEFAGWLTGDARRALIAGSDVLVIPSVWPEPCGLVGLEAQAVGVPVAAFAVGGIPEWLRDGENGRLAPGPPSASRLAAAIVQCAENRPGSDDGGSGGGATGDGASDDVSPPSRPSDADGSRRHVEALLNVLESVAA